FAGLWQIEPGAFGWMLAMGVFPWLALWAAVIYFEQANPFQAIARAFRLMRWGQGLTLGFLIVNLCVLLLYFLSTQVWDILLNFFSWLVPSGGENMAIFSTIATVGLTLFITYFGLAITFLTGAWQYFSGREIADAASLQAGIEQIGMARQIRGLARE
ncbi:MAG: hypothetical protein ABIQ93_17195, partial [Saprospiraceae bacterium]